MSGPVYTRDIHRDANISATTTGYTLKGGRYGVTCVGSGFGTVTIQKLSNDGSSWVTAMTAFAANGYQVGDFAQGTYRTAVASTTGVYVEIESIAVPLA